MSGHVADLFADLSLRTTQFSAGLNVAVTASRNAGSAMSSSFGTGPQAALSETDRAARRMSQNVSGYMKDISRIITGILISQAFYGLIRSIREATDEVVHFSLMMEQAAVSFEFMMGSAQKSTQFIGAMEDFAAKTPFSMEDATRGARRLQAMGFEAKNVIPVLRSLADVMALSGNQDPLLLSRMTITLGQIKNSSKTSAREIRELILAGIPANKILQEELGLTAEQIQNIGKQAIPGEVALAALMTGIEKRYGGAADAIQKTTLGLVSTIKDNLLFISRDLLKTPMASYNAFVTKVADGLERVRMEGRKFGTGGIIDALFPPKLQATARIVFTSIGNITNNVKRLVAAFGPAASALNEFIFRGLALLLPVVASVTNAISRLAYWASHSVPGVKYLGMAILALMSAGAATAMILHLSWAIRVLGIAKAVAGAVMLLSKTISVLYIAMTKNPVTAVIMLISAALLGLAMSSATVSAWLDRVMKQMMGLMGMNGDSFALTDDATLGQQDIFNEKIIEGGDAWDEFGDSAEKAGKKVQDNILAFDEVFQIEDPNGDGGGGGLKIPDIKVPNLPDITIPHVDIPPTGSTSPITLPPPILPPPILPIIPTLPVLHFPVPIIPPPIIPRLPDMDTDPAPVLEKARRLLEDWVGEAGRILEGWRQTGTQTVQGWANDFNTLLDGWWVNGVKPISGWATQTGAILGQWTIDGVKSISDWGLNLGVVLGLALAGALKSISDWSADTQAELAMWVTDGIDIVAGWAASLGKIVEQWKVDMKKRVSDTWEDITDFFASGQVKTVAIVVATVAAIVLAFMLLPAELAAGAFAVLLLTVVTTFTNVKTAAASEIDKTKTVVVDKWQGIKDRISDVWDSLKVAAKAKWDGIGQVIKGSINSVIDLINKFTGLWNKLSFETPSITMPNGSVYGGGTIGVPYVPPIAHLARGGVVTRDQIVRVSEANRPEGVVPLSGGGATTIANALADAIVQRLDILGAGANKGEIVLQVGMLIGDTRSYTELERRLRSVRLNEQVRGVS